MVDNDGGELASAGTIYVVTADAMANYTFGAARIGLVVQPGIVLHGTGAGGNVVEVWQRDFAWVEGTLDATGASRGLTLDTTRFSVAMNVAVTHATDDGVRVAYQDACKLVDITAASNGGCGVYIGHNAFANQLSRITATNNTLCGVAVWSSDDNVFSNIEATQNTHDGILVSYSSDNRFSDIRASNNNNNGVRLIDHSDNNRLSRVVAANNGAVGVLCSISLRNNTLTDITACNNMSDGVQISSMATNHVLTNVTAANNVGVGLYVSQAPPVVVLGVSASNNLSGVQVSANSWSSYANITAVNNSSVGIYLIGTSNTAWENLVAADNASGINSSDGSSYNSFMGTLAVGNNMGEDCYVSFATNPGLDDDAAPGDVSTDEIHNGLCVQEGSSSFGTAVTGVDGAALFVGKVTADDGTNASDTLGAAAHDDITDWLHFDNAYRGWGKDGAAFTDATNIGACDAGTCRIWDWSLVATGEVSRAMNAVPTGDDTWTQRWTGAAASQADCDTLKPGSVFATDHCETTFLRNAVELTDDGIGNDNALCESHEVCLFMPNAAAYQGHGSLVSAGSFTDGTLVGVTLVMYANNGR